MPTIYTVYRFRDCTPTKLEVTSFGADWFRQDYEGGGYWISMNCNPDTIHTEYDAAAAMGMKYRGELIAEAEETISRLRGLAPLVPAA